MINSKSWKTAGLKNRTKKLIIGVIIAFLLVILLFPARIVYRDGGTVQYKAVLYEVTKYHIGVGEYTAGWNVKIFGIEVYENRYIVNES